MIENNLIVKHNLYNWLVHVIIDLNYVVITNDNLFNKKLTGLW